MRYLLTIVLMYCLFISGASGKI